MQKSLVFLAALLATSGAKASVTTTEADSSQVINLEEAIVVATPKQTTQLRKQSLSANIYSGKELEQLQVTSLKGLSALTPNFFMPDYGSRYTSAVYIRGIGSRMNTPAVGLYVDNIAYVDKSAYDFSFTDIERVDVLRGPQATLYGRNTMGGVIR
ncbi:MAG: Plug domain-containing protein, partial [Bacteroidaceae bacterium]|nr:Plug domain-containing protein [Bacteroidaceae bacterium]